MHVEYFILSETKQNIFRLRKQNPQCTSPIHTYFFSYVGTFQNAVTKRILTGTNVSLAVSKRTLNIKINHCSCLALFTSLFLPIFPKLLQIETIFWYQKVNVQSDHVISDCKPWQGLFLLQNGKRKWSHRNRRLSGLPRAKEPNYGWQIHHLHVCFK